MIKILIIKRLVHVGEEVYTSLSSLHFSFLFSAQNMSPPLLTLNTALSIQ
ncbi:unnamed protein product [Periconia digitata]|uniref:Uncharacterized protein n=1 Tax=Periconia digitata TaxID=1303443 RepID=A0A9W4UGT9_9PLEO|nr:unnamed protein product [Periconia digitata]